MDYLRVIIASSAADPRPPSSLQRVNSATGDELCIYFSARDAILPRHVTIYTNRLTWEVLGRKLKQ